MAYENDPREWQIRPESGVTLEEDNRYEEMWHWGAHVLDLCNLPVEEYMKPMEVRGVGGGDDSGSTPTAKKVTLTVKVIAPNGDVIDGNGNVVETVENPTGHWVVSATRDKNFEGITDITLSITDTNDTITTKTVEINGVSSDKTVTEEIGINDNTELKSLDCTFDDGKSTKDIKDDDGKTIATVTINIPTKKEDEMNLYYWFGVHKVGYKDSELISFISTDADESDGGFDFDVIEPKSDLIIAENTKFQNGESPYDDDDTAQDIFDEFLANMQAASAYSLSVFVPTEILETKELVVSSYNDLGESISSDIENTVTIEGIECKQYTFYIGPDGYRYKLTADNQQFRFNAKIR